MHPKTKLTETVEAQGVDVESVAPPALDWQQAAEQVVALAEEMLWTDEGQAVLDDLTAQGLSLKTIREARLGFIPGGERQSRTMEGLIVPCGLTIPWFVGGELWAVRVRHQNGQPSYTAIPGGSTTGLYGVERLMEPLVAVFCEDELEAMLVRQEAKQLVAPLVLMGSVSLTRMCRPESLADDRVRFRLCRLGVHRSLPYLLSTCQLRLPHGKSIVEFHRGGGDVYTWIKSGIEDLDRDTIKGKADGHGLDED